MGMSREEADQLATLLNQISTATLDAVRSGDLQQRLGLAGALRELRGQFEAGSAVAPFLGLLIRWLEEGRAPSPQESKALDPLFQRALQRMRAQVGEEATAEKEPAEPISRRVLAQLVAAVVAAHSADEQAVQEQLAAHLITIQGKLPAEWRGRLGPLLENLRSLLGGADPRILPPVPDPAYQKLWRSAQELLLSGEFGEEVAHDQLLERLVHNTRFTRRADSEALTEGFLRALLDVQRQALEGQQPAIATLVGAIRLYLQGGDPTPLSAQLEGEEQAAWQRIMEEEESP